jgi:hypothetical protein
MHDGSGFYFNSEEPRWSREAFAAERTRLPWEGGASLGFGDQWNRELS